MKLQTRKKLMNNDCCRSTPDVAVPCVYDLMFIAKALAEKTAVSIEGISGTVEGIARTGGGKIMITFTSGSMVCVNAR